MRKKKRFAFASKLSFIAKKRIKKTVITIKAIETEYKGFRFRSRLEARWAVFFDACGFKWEYEPEGYEIDGVQYLPDFRLYDVERRSYDEEDAARPFFVEVKGEYDDESEYKIVMLSEHYPVYVVRQIPYADSIWGVFSTMYDDYMEEPMFFSYNYIDKDNYPAGLFVNKNGHPMIAGPDHLDDLDNVDWNKTKVALLKARSARFEHGEKG